MVERVAQALLAAIDASEYNFGERGVRLTAKAAARAAIAAMREPTEGMLEVADVDEPQQAINTWHAMVDAALDEKETYGQQAEPDPAGTRGSRLKLPG